MIFSFNFVIPRTLSINSYTCIKKSRSVALRFLERSFVFFFFHGPFNKTNIKLIGSTSGFNWCFLNRSYCEQFGNWKFWYIKCFFNDRRLDVFDIKVYVFLIRHTIKPISGNFGIFVLVDSLRFLKYII